MYLYLKRSLGGGGEGQYPILQVHLVLPQFTWAMACFQLCLGLQHSNMGTPRHIVAAQQSFNSLLDHRDNYCSAVGCYKIVQCYVVSQVQNNCCPTERQCVAQCKQFNSLPPTADELFSLLWGSGASLSIATSFNPSWVASSLFQQNLNPNHQDCWKVGLWQRSGGAVAFF